MRNTTDDQAAARAVFLYPHWQPGLEVNTGERYQHEEKLYKAKADHTTQENWAPGQGTESIWEVIDVIHTGTKDDPIPFAVNMEVFKDKYYTWADKLYICTRDSGQPLQNTPAELIGNYFEEAENE